MVQESTVVLNLQIYNGRQDTHAMAHAMAHAMVQQTHLCGIVELGSARPSVSCLSVPRIKKVDCRDRAQPTPEAGLSFITKGRNNHISQLSQWSGLDLTTI